MLKRVRSDLKNDKPSPKLSFCHLGPFPCRSFSKTLGQVSRDMGSLAAQLYGPAKKPTFKQIAAFGNEGLGAGLRYALPQRP